MGSPAPQKTWSRWRRPPRPCLDNQTLRNALREEIALALAEDEALAQELARLLGQAHPAGQTVIASGCRTVAIGNSVSESVIVNGDNNKINKR